MKHLLPILSTWCLSTLLFTATAYSQCSAGDVLQTYCYDGNEGVDNVIFELCPTAGMAAEAEIIQGSFDAFNASILSFSVYEGATGSGTSGVIRFGGPASGDVSGNTITGNTVDNCLIFVVSATSSSASTGSCDEGFSDELQVCGRSVAGSAFTFMAPADLCSNAGVQTALSGGLPTGGTYSGPGVTDDGNGTTYSFDPAAAGVGIITISYGTGGNVATDQLEVLNSTATIATFDDLCIDAGITSGGGGSPMGGTYSGPGVTDNTDGTYSFNPISAGLGTHTITYSFNNGCGAVATESVTVTAACGCPSGETTYFYCYDNNETNTVAFEVCPSTAGSAVTTSINMGGFDVTDDNLSVYQGTSGSATSGTLVLGPISGDVSGNTLTGTLADECLIFVINSGTSTSCSDGFESALRVCAMDAIPAPSFTAPADVCSNAGVQNNLGGGLPTGGVYSGPGVTDDGNGMSYSFDPTAAGIGLQTLVYTFGGMMASDELEVVAAGQTSFPNPADVCVDMGLLTDQSGGSPAGGTYSGPGVTDNGNGTYNFNPGIAGIGTHTIIYTASDACGESATATINVTAACACPVGEMSFFNCYDNDETNVVIFEICPTAGLFAEATINAGSYDSFDDDLTIYQGASGSATAGTLALGPINGDLAGNTITATVVDQCLIFVSNSGNFGSCADGLETGLSVCGRSVNGVTFTALDDISVNAGVQTGLSGGLPTGGVYSGPGVTDDGNGMTYSFDPAFAGIGVHTLTYTVGGNSATDDVEVLNLQPPSFSKSFNSNQIGPGSVSTLTFTINNGSSATAATDLSFVDNLPAGMTIASPLIVANSCNGTIDAIAGGTSISLMDGQVSPGADCTISVNVTSSTPGTVTNTTGNLTSNAGNSGTASAILEVLTNRPGFSKSFSPAMVNLGERSTLIFTIDNTANTAAHSNITFTDNLPVGMIVASPSNASTTCVGGLVTADPGTGLVGYTGTIFTDASVAAGASCTVSVDVVGNGIGVLQNQTGNLTSFNNFFQNFTSGKATASLEVVDPTDLFIQKTFVPNPVNPGSVTELEFTITNFNRDFAATNISFTDDLTTVLAGLTATGTPLNDLCGAGAQLSGTTMLSFTGGTLAPNSSCTFRVPIQVPGGAAAGSYTNTTSAVTGTINGNSITGNTAMAELFIANLPTFTKNFLNDPIVAGGTSTLEFTITNTSTSSALTDLTFNDPIAEFLNGTTVSALPAAGSCGVGSIFFTTTVGGLPSFQMIDGNIPASGSCTFSVDLTVPNNTPEGTYTNTTSRLSGNVDGGPVSAAPATDDLTVLAAPQLSKLFLNDPVNAGEIVDLEFTITYDDFASGDATNISFTDDLNAVIAGMSGIGLPLTDVCGTGSTITGTTNLMLSGGTLSPGGSCTFTIPVQVPAGAVPGTYTNSTSSLNATVGGQMATTAAATDDLDIGGINFTKEFLDDNVLPGEVTTLRFTIENTSVLDATSIFFSDNLGGLISGMAAQTPLPTAPCGASSITTGTNNFILFNGEVASGSSCSFDIQVLVPTSAASETYNNVTSNLSATLAGMTRSFPPATDQLIVNNNLLQLTKTFTDDPVMPGGTVTVEYMLTNLDPDNAISNIEFTDDFDGALTGLVATGLPMNNVCNAGSQVSGTGLVTFTGGSLAAGASCTFSVILQVPANATPGEAISSTTSNPTGDLNGLAVEGDSASDDLLIQGLTFSKAFAGTLAPGETTTLTFTITNSDMVNSAMDISFTDDLDAFISGMVATNLPLNDVCGTGSAVMGTSTINFGRGELAAGQSCTFDVMVMAPCGTASGTYTNTTSEMTGLNNNGGLTVAPAMADLVVTASGSASFTAPADLCIDAGTQTGLNDGIPTGGVYTGPGVTDDGNGMTYSFDPAAAMVGTHTITYTLTDANSCETIVMDEIEVFALPVVTFTALNDLCENAGEQVGLVGGSPLSNTGSYNGPGVTDNGDGMSYNFDPAVAGVGVHTITYTFTDGNGCIASASDMVEVLAVPNAMFTAPADLCIDAGVQTALSGGTPMGGVYSGSGVTDDGNGMTFSFDPAAATVGTHTITYTIGVSGCIDSATDDIEVFALPTNNFVTVADLCIDGGVQTGSGTGMFASATFSGPGVTDNGDNTNYSFDPATAGVGVHTITYSFTDVNGCSNTATDEVEVFALPTVTFTALPDLCIDAGMQVTLTGGNPQVSSTTINATASYSGPGVTNNGGISYDFDPAVAGTGTHTISYTFTDGNGCTNSASDEVEVFPLPNAMFTAPADLCVDAGVQNNLSGGTPMGGVYSGSGVTDDGNGMTYSFDPAAATTGTHTITYTISVSGCIDSATDDIEVFALPTNNFVTVADLCIDGGVQTGSGTGMFASATFSGPGVTDNGDDATYSFDPATAGAGVHTITYSFTDANGCSNTATDEVEVFALPTVTFTALPDLCIDAGMQVTLTGGNPQVSSTTINATASYSGPGVTNNGGISYDFDPAAAGVGTHILTYTFTDANGCSDSATDEVEVFALPIVSFTAPTLDVCIEDPIEATLGGGSPMGGVYAGTGVTDDGNGMTFSFDPTASAPAGGDIPVTYTFTDANGCTASATDDIFVDPICCELIVTCPAADLGPIACADAIPTAATDEASFEALGGTIGDDPEQCGTLVITSVDVFDPTTDICNGRTLTRTYTISDDMTSETCVQTLTILAPTAPVIVCPANVTIDCGTSTDTNTTGMAIATADCGQAAPTINFTDVQTPLASGYTITRTFTATDDCGRMSNCEQIITVSSCEFEITDPCACLNNATVIDVDNNTGGDDGQFSELVAITGPNGGPIADPNLIFEVIAITGGTDAFAPAPVAPAQTAGVAIPLGTQLVYNPVTMHYELPFYHVDEIGYTITVQQIVGGALGQILGPIGNTCAYPNPTFDPALPDDICPNGDPITLGGTAPNGADMVTFTIDGDPATIFDPTMLTVGDHTVVMTYDGATVVNNGSGTLADPNFPGCTQTVQKVVAVEDTEDPVAVCQAFTLQLDDLGEATLTAADINNNSTDNCGPLSFALSQTDFTCDNVGDVMVTLTVTDGAGLMDDCVAVVTVEDNVAPEVICMSTTIELNVGGMATLTTDQVDNGTNDACGIAMLTLSQTEFTCADVGDNIVTLTATDNNGNTADCPTTIVITVEDNIAPEALCQDVTVQLDEDGNGSTTPEAVDNGSTDACGIQSITLDVMDFTCDDVGDVVVTLTVTDNNDNPATCMATVTVEDNVLPEALCQDITVQVSATTAAVSITPDDIDNGSNDACGIESLVLDIMDFTCEDEGDNPVVLTVTDVNGNVNTCDAIVTVEDDNVPFQFGCIGDLNVTLGDDCTARITPDMVVTGAFLQCVDEAIVTIDGQLTDVAEGCGNHTYSIDLIEDGVLIYTCWGNLFTEDKTAPEVDCPADATSVEVVVQTYPINGELTATDPTLAISNWSCFQDFFSPLAGDHPYDVLEFTVGATDFYTFDVDSDFGDAGMTMYQGGFDVNNPCQNIIGTNGDDFATQGTPFDPRLRFSLPLIAGETYQIVVTNWAPGDLGNYVVNIFADNEGSINGITATQTTQTFDLFCEDVDYIRFTTPQSWIVNADGSLDFTATRNEFFGGSTAALNAFIEKLSRAGLPTATDNCGQILITLVDGTTTGNGDCGDIQMTRTFTIQDRYNNCTDSFGAPGTEVCTQTITFRRPTLGDVEIPPFLVVVECDENYEGDGAVGGPDDNVSAALAGYPFIRTAAGFQDLNQSYCNIGASYSDEPRVEICEGTFNYRREWNIIDWCNPGGSGTLDQYIKVGDFTGPTFVDAPTMLDISTSPFGCEANIAVPTLSLTDGNSCSAVFPTSYTVFANGTTFFATGTYVLQGGAYVASPAIVQAPIGDHTIEFCAEDACGNETCITVNVSVGDEIEPSAACDDEINVSIGGGDIAGGIEGLARIFATDVDEGSNDNCGEVTLDIRRNFWRNNDCDPSASRWSPWGEFVDFYCCDIANEITIELRVTDESGNTNVCWLTVTPEDKLNPFCYAPDNQTISCADLPFSFPGDIETAYAEDFEGTSEMMDALFGAASGTDNCAVDAIVERQPSININDCGWGTITRRFEAWQARPEGDVNGNGELDANEAYRSTNSCSQLITITEVHDFTIDFPEDAEADCGTPDIPTVVTETEGCDILAINIGEPVRFSATGDECYKMSITYDIINWCLWDGEYTGYVLPRMTEDDGEPLAVDRAVEGNERPVITYTDAQGLCIDRRHTDRDGDSSLSNCDSPSLPNYGRYIYTQFIKVYDTTVPVVTVDPFGGPTDQCPNLLPEQFGDFTGSCDTPVEITFSVADDCELFDNDGDLVISIVDAQLDAFAVDASGDGEIVASEFVSDGSVLGNITDNGDGTFVFAGTYPIITSAMGDNVMHAVRILFEDGCGNQVSEFIEFDVIDCKGPAPICINGLTVTLMPQQEGGCAMAIWASDFEGSPISDCTGQGPEEFLGNPRVTKYAIYRASEVEGDPNFEPNPADTGLVLTDEDDPTTIVYVYAFDEEGNYDYCETYVLVQEHSMCNEDGGSIAGIILTEEAESVEGVEVNLNGGMSMSMTTQVDGSYGFDNLTAGFDYSVTPYLNANPLNGVTTFDLVLMSKHILGTQPLNSPYKLIAADINRSNTITTFDMIQLRKLILNIDTEFSNNTSWRFVETAYDFPQPTNPWVEAFPELINENNLATAVLDADFVGVKIGDVNGSAQANAQAGEDRTLNGIYNLEAEDIDMKAGNTYTVAVTGADVEGFQGTLALDGAELVDIEYGVASAENFGVHPGLTHRRLSRHMPNPPFEGGSYEARMEMVAISWNGKATTDRLFSLVIRTTEDVQLSDVLSINSRYTQAEAYRNGNIGDLGINFSHAKPQAAGFELYQNTPNPFKAETLIGFTLPAEAKATITISDASGRVLTVMNTDATAGYNMINVTREMIQGATGVLTYTVTSNEFTATKTMVVVK